MIKKTYLHITTLLITIAFLSTPFSHPSSARTENNTSATRRGIDTQTRQFIPGRVLVKFKEYSLTAAARNLTTEFGLRTIETLGATGVQVLELPAGADDEAVVKALQSRSDVEFAELDRIVPPADLIPNDPWYTNWQWHLRKIQGPTAWSTTSGSSNIVIAILDTGVDGTHEDLSSKLVPGWNVYNNNADTTDVNGHGTLVAGTAAAISNNGLGVASIAWGCRIMPIRISDDSGFGYFSTMASGLTWAADHGARLANISYRASASSTVASAAQYFQSKGGVVTVAAGNEGAFDASPDNPYVLTVGGTDSNDLRYLWSNTGNNLDLCAPGSVYTTLRGGGYTSASGTSVAAPIVAGIAALMLSANNALTPDEVQELIKQSADELGSGGWDTNYGWGRANAARALELAGGDVSDDTPPVVSIVSPANGASLSGTATIQVTATDNRDVSSVTMELDGTVIGTDTTAPYAFTWNTLGALDGSHSLNATARDSAGNSANASISISVRNVSDTTPPTISIVSPANGAKVTTSVTVKVNAFDQVGVVSVELYVDGVLTGASTTAPFSIKWNAKRARAGAHSLQTKAYDAAGNTAISEPRTVYR